MTPDEIAELEDRAKYYPERITPEDLDRMRAAFADVARTIEEVLVPIVRAFSESLVTLVDSVSAVLRGYGFDPEAGLRERAIEQGITEVDIRSVDVETQTVRLWNRLVYEIEPWR